MIDSFMEKPLPRPNPIPSCLNFEYFRRHLRRLPKCEVGAVFDAFYGLTKKTTKLMPMLCEAIMILRMRRTENIELPPDHWAYGNQTPVWSPEEKRDSLRKHYALLWNAYRIQSICVKAKKILDNEDPLKVATIFIALRRQIKNGRLACWTNGPMGLVLHILEPEFESGSLKREDVNWLNKYC